MYEEKHTDGLKVQIKRKKNKKKREKIDKRGGRTEMKFSKTILCTIISLYAGIMSGIYFRQKPSNFKRILSSQLAMIHII